LGLLSNESTDSFRDKHMKIDLHCHTMSTKKGDGAGRNVTPDVFRAKIEMADVKIAAITNYNND